MKERFTAVLDLFFPLFRRFMPLHTFRYAACGGLNTIIGLLVYFTGYHYIFRRTLFDLGFFAFKPHMAALFLSSAVSFVLGFLLNKYVVFTGSYLRGRVQLFRYLLTFTANLVLNYVLLKLMVEKAGWSPVFSQVLTIAVVVSLSYILQRHFTFRGHTGRK
jgi:putative flippase GtrA